MMDRSEAIAMKSDPVETYSADLVEAASYALLQRLAPAFRHRMVGGLHPIELIIEAVEQRLQAPVPDLANARENLERIKALSRSAVLSCTNVISWLAPDEGAVTMLGEGIDECLALLSTDFDMRGFAVRNEAREIGVDVSRTALRNVLTASLIAATDAAPQPSDLVLTTELSQGHVLVSITVCPADRVAGFPDAVVYRRLEWGDVAALAQSKSVDLLHQGDRLTIRYALADPAWPLRAR
jgi:C4-dicarboxylate-specific signal transduction histidine kinase